MLTFSKFVDIIISLCSFASNYYGYLAIKKKNAQKRANFKFVGIDMKINERQILILKALEKEVFISVETLSKRLYTSPSSIRRDLDNLEKNNLVHRTHGGVTIFNPGERVATFARRMTQNVQGKHAVAKKASEFLRDGMNIFLDSSTTSNFLIPHLAKYDGITIFTNNMETALNAISNGINTHCTGGKSFNGSPILIGRDAERSIRNIHTDLLFFSSQSLDSKGVISDSCEEETYLRSLMLEHADKKVFLCDYQKINQKSLYALVSLDEIDICILEKEWPALEGIQNCKIIY